MMCRDLAEVALYIHCVCVCVCVCVFVCVCVCVCVYVQVHIPSELHAAGPVGHRLCDTGRHHTADHPSEQEPLSGSH